MYEDLREKAVEKIEKDKERRRGIFTVGYIFSGTSLILVVLAWKIGGPAAFWLQLPILGMAFVYGMMYFSEFGFPFTKDSQELTEDEIEREMVNIYRKSNINTISDDGVDELELREIEELRTRLDDGEQFV